MTKIGKLEHAPHPHFSAATVVLTGGAGKVGRPLRQALAGQFGHVRIIDVVDPSPLAAWESWVCADVSDLDAVTGALSGAVAVIHMAVFPSTGAFNDILRVNGLGTYVLYEAARQNGIERIVLGSTNHVVGFYPRSARIGADVPMRPDSLYGLSKGLAELTAGLFYDKAGIRSLVVRIGNAGPQPADARATMIWVSPRDLAQLVMIGLTHSDITCDTVYGVSRGDVPWWDNSRADALGYAPVDDARDHAPDEWPPPRVLAFPEISEHFQGGRFCVTAHDGVLRERPYQQENSRPASND